MLLAEVPIGKTLRTATNKLICLKKEQTLHKERQHLVKIAGILSSNCHRQVGISLISP